MADVNITRISSKGQIVIPLEMRKGFLKGEKLIIIRNGGQIILKKASEMDKNLEEDLIFAKRTEEALLKYEKGEFKQMDFDDFLKDMKKW